MADEESRESQTEPPEGQGGKGAGEQRGVLRRFWSRIAHGWRWLRQPDQVGRPITLRPRSVRLLVLLILGNLFVLVLLIVALYQAITLPAIVESPPPVVVTVSPGPSPTPGPTPAPAFDMNVLPQNTPAAIMFSGSIIALMA